MTYTISYDPYNYRALRHPKPKRDQAPALGGAVPREEPCVGRIVVRFTLYRIKPVDPDAAAGGTKDLIDGLRHAGLIPDDSPWHIKLEVEQVKVAHGKDQCTKITIETP